MRRNSTTRALGAIGLAVSAIMALAAPVAAQYGDDPSVRERVGNTTPEQAAPATPVVFTTDQVFAPSAVVEVFLVRALQGATPTQVGPAVIANINGSVTASFTVPAGTPPGIYFVYATGTGENGEELRVVSVLIVLAPGASAAAFPPAAGGSDAAPGPATATDGAPAGGESSPPGTPGTAGAVDDTAATGEGGGASATTPPAGQVATPPEIQAIQYPADVEQVLYDEAVASGEPITLDANGLVLAGGTDVPVTGDAAIGDSAPAPVAAALVAGAFVAGGLLVLRRRQQHSS